MPIIQMILPECDHEMANTRKTLERVPDDKFAWKPHEKSTSLGGLATHLANIPSWTKNTFEQDELDISPNGEPYQLEEAKSRAELLETFDKNVTAARAALGAATDEGSQGKWSLRMTAKAILSLPRPAGMPPFPISHSIHHPRPTALLLRLPHMPP